MNLASVEKVANAVLYEGYLLYPYRANSTKNRQRWNFGTLYPCAYAESLSGAEPCSFHAEFLTRGARETQIEVRFRFLQFVESTREPHAGPDAGAESQSWHEGVERNVDIAPVSLDALLHAASESRFEVNDVYPPDESGKQRGISGVIRLRAELVADAVYRVALDVTNTTDFNPESGRNAALLHALVSAHAIVQASSGELISLLEPPEELREGVAACRNAGVFPVLAGEPGQRDTMLISPIILYDYPQAAPESSGDFFDATEIDEMLTLRVLTLTEEEKEQMRRTDPRARDIWERTRDLPEEQLLKMHGAIRSLRRGGEQP